MKSIFNEINLKENELIKINKKASFFYDGRLHEIDFSTPLSTFTSLTFFKLIPLKLKADIKVLIFFLKCIKSFREIKKDYSNFNKYNYETAYYCLQKIFDDKTIEDVFEPLSETFLFSSTRNISKAMFMVLLGAFLDPGNKLYHLKYGTNILSKKIEKILLNREIKIVNSKVIKIQKHKKIFRVQTKENVFFSKSIISSIPLPELKKILFNYKKVMQNFSNIKYSSIICGHIGLKKPIEKIKDNHIVFIKSSKDKPVVFAGETTFKNKTLAPFGRGLLYTLISSQFTNNLMKLSKIKIEKIIDKRLEKIFPDYTQNKLFTKIFIWKHAFTLTDINYFKNMKVETKSEGFFICGDSILIGLDGVIESGKIAAKKTQEFLNF